MKPLRYFVAVILVAGACLTGRALYLHAKADRLGHAGLAATAVRKELA